MGVQGFQNHRLLGSKMQFRRDATSATDYPWIDMGVVETISPNQEVEEVIVEDGSSGVLREVDRELVKINESYTVVVKNLNLENLAMLYLSDRPTAFAQAAAAASCVVPGFLGALHKIEDADRNPIHMLAAISGAYYGGTVTEKTDLSAINASAKTLSFGADPGTGNGDLLIVDTDGLADLANAKTYTQVGTVSGSGPYVVTVGETPSSSESGLTGTVVHIEGTGTIVPADKFEVVSLDDGSFRLLAGAGFTNEDDITVIYTTAAVSGLRKIEPQNIEGTVKGVVDFIYGQSNNLRKLYRRARVSITPAGATFQQQGDTSTMSLTVAILSDLTSETPAGVLVEAKGDLPATS